MHFIFIVSKNGSVWCECVLHVCMGMYVYIGCGVCGVCLCVSKFQVHYQESEAVLFDDDSVHIQ